MKTMIITLVAAFSVTAFAKSEYKTEIVCGLSENPDVCTEVTYKVRPVSKQETKTVECNPLNDTVYCPPKAYGVPKWLQKLNEAAKKAGLTAPDADRDANKPY